MSRDDNLEPIWCDWCKSVIAEVKDNRVLIIKIKHHGRQHMTVIPLDKLIKKTAK